MSRGRSEGILLGRKDGFAEGARQGAYQKALQDAANFKHLGVSIEIIAQATGLSKQEVENL